MTDIPMKLIINCETGEEQYLPFTEEEIAQMEANRLAFEAAEESRLAEEAAKAAIKASALAKLAALGLTEEEASAIAGI